MIRRAQENDINGINNLLYQVNNIHADGRPDLFKYGGKKYNDEQLLAIINDNSRPIFVYTDEKQKVLGYAFCIFQNNYGNKITLYIDDLCVDENCRGQHIGTKLYEHVVSFAKEHDCYHITLNVWCLNESAMKFYEKCGLTPLKIMMEKTL